MRGFIALLCAVTIGPANLVLASQDVGSPIPPDQLDSLVAPIALYPDPLLAQTLAASTYPLEVLQLQQWMARNPGLKDQALADAVAQQPWDPSVQALAAVPDVLKRLADDVQWTTDLGNAFLAQQSDVMDAVQRMRQKAQQNGQLQSNQAVRVEQEVVENKSVIVVEPAAPDVVYVPSYNPTVVYGAPVYPYPPIDYPSAGAYAAGRAISWGVGAAMGAAWGGGWGWNVGWGRNDIHINNANFYNRTANIRSGNVARANGTWQHNAAHRGGTPYRDQATANRFGGTTRGDSLANRPHATGTTGLGGGTRPGSSAVGNRPSGSFSGAPSGANRIGNRDLSGSSFGGNTNAFGGGGQRFDGSGARENSIRGGSSLNSAGGGGFSRGGGGFSGGARRGGGGGRRR